MKIRHRKITPREEGYVLEFEERNIPISIKEFEELCDWKARED